MSGFLKDKKSLKYLRWYTLPIFLIWLSVYYINSYPHLWNAWQTDEYSHGVILPFISVFWSIYLLQNKPVDFKTSLWGVPVLIAGFLLNWGGELISNNWLSSISIIISFSGLIYIFLGSAAIKRIFPAIFLFFFSIPLPATIMPSLTADLQLISSDFGVRILQFLAISVYREGNIIDLGTHKLDIVTACSGLRYIFPLISLSYLLSFLSFKTWWKRLALILSAIAIAIGINSVRIALTGILFNTFGIESIEGKLHYVEGFIFFALSLVALIIFKIILDTFPPKKKKGMNFDYSISFKKPLWNNAIPPSKSICLIVITLFTFFSTMPHLLAKREGERPVLSRQDFSSFPLQIKNWTGKPDVLAINMLQSLKLSDYFMGHYVREETSGGPITLYVAYYEEQSQENSIHSPKICLPGSGWITQYNEIRQVGDVKVNVDVLQKDGQKIITYYWFREGGFDAATNLDVKKYLLLNALRYGRTDGSLIRLSAQVREGDDEKSVKASMDDFLSAVLPILPRYLPPTKLNTE